MLPFYIRDKITLEFYSRALTKLHILNLDILKSLLKPRLLKEYIIINILNV